MQWHIIKTGRVLVDAGGPFGLVPQSLWSKKYPLDEHHRVPMDLNCLLIHSEGKIILVDTGLGDKLDEKAQRNWAITHPDGALLGNLKELGIAPEDVDIVIDTHLHWDHCGGNTRIHDGQVVPTFPRAEYLVQYVEWADAMHPDARTRATYLLDNYRPVWQRGQFRFLYGDTHITAEVRCVVTRGHTRTAWVTAYDIEPLETIATKKKWQAWALETNAALLFEHDTTTPLGHLIKDEDGKLKIEPINQNHV